MDELIQDVDVPRGNSGRRERIARQVIAGELNGRDHTVLDLFHRVAKQYRVDDQEPQTGDELIGQDGGDVDLRTAGDLALVMVQIGRGRWR